VAESIKVPEDQFNGVLRNLLNAASMPLALIPRKRDPAKKPGPKKRN
jgi:hypothetical protein